MIELIDISKKFNAHTVNETTVFSDFNFTVEKGQFISVIGSNGSGKTTLLNITAGSILPDVGKVLLNGKDITTQPEFIRARRFGRVFQDPSKGVASNMTIMENLSLADNKGKMFGLTRGVSKKKFQEYQDMVASIGLGLEDKMHVKMGALSGGQRQSVSLLMATMTPIDILLLDEHTAALDPKTARVVLDLTERIVNKEKITTMMITHNMKDAIKYGNRLIMMYCGKVVMDVKDEDKKKLTVEDLMRKFDEMDELYENK